MFPCLSKLVTCRCQCQLSFYKGSVKLFSECDVGTVDAIMYDACAAGLLMGVGDDMTLAAAKSSIYQ